MRGRVLALIPGFWLLLGACAPLSPEEEARHALFWEAANECSGRGSGLAIRVRDVAPNGRVYIEDYTGGSDIQPFLACYEKRAREKLRERLR